MKIKHNAFTLIELLIVIAIAVIIAGALIPLFSVGKQDAKIAKLLTLVDTLRGACERFYVDTGVYPTEYGSSPQDCADPDTRRLSCDSGISGWNGPYIGHPFSEDDNPIGDVNILANVLDATNNLDFDLDGNSVYERQGPGNMLVFHVESESIAKAINDVIDRGMPQSGWEASGKVKFFETHPGIGSNMVLIYLIGGEAP